MKFDTNMTMLRKIIISFLVILTTCGPGLAQTYSDIIREYRYAAAGVYHPYHPGDLTDSKAPRGFKPFYISHFGRHGSRYLAHPESYEPLYDGAGKVADLLSEEGGKIVEQESLGLLYVSLCLYRRKGRDNLKGQKKIGQFSNSF